MIMRNSLRLLAVIILGTCVTGLTGCGENPNVVVPSYLKNADGEVTKLTNEEQKKLGEEAEELHRKRKAGQKL